MTQRIRSGGVETIVEERVAEEAECRRLAMDAIARWQRGEPADAEAVLASFPDIRRHVPVVLDLAYEEYCQRRSAGEAIDSAAFCARFPQYASHLSKLLGVHGALAPTVDEFGECEWPIEGELFLGFSIREELGRGAIARVYLAEEPALGGRLVALKVSRHGENEAETLGKLAHPNIVPVFSVVQEEISGLTAVCMPYLGRATLADVAAAVHSGGAPPRSANVIRETINCRNSGLPSPTAASDSNATPDRFTGPYIDAVIRFGCQLAEALALTHEKGILHRDLKPSNVLLTPDGVPMLLDFNLSVDAQAQISRVGGTLPYMAPEQIRQVFSPPNTPIEIDAQSDIFSLGVILYELLTGRLPFGPAPDEASAGTALVLVEQQERGCPPVRSANRLVDQRLAAVVESCLNLNPQHRPQSARQLESLLRQGLGCARRVRRWMTARPLLAAALGIAAATLVAAVALFFTTRDPYSVRQFNAGRNKYEQGAYRDALSHFQEALDDQPGSIAARFALARTRVRLKDFPAAAAQFESLYSETRNPKAAAGAAYCRGEERSYSAAVLLYQQSIADGFETAIIHNNLGLSLQVQGSGNFNQAREHFTRALEMDSQLQQPRFNRAALVMNQSQFRNQSVPREALTDLQIALKIGPATPTLLELMAVLHLICQDKPSSSVSDAIDCLEQAADLGLTPHQIRNNLVFNSLAREPRFQRLLARPNPSSKAAPMATTLDPLRDEPFALDAGGF